MIENFETNQQVLYLPGGYTMYLETTWIFVWSSYTTFVPLCPPSYRKKIVNYHHCYLSHVTFQPIPNYKRPGPKMLTKYLP